MPFDWITDEMFNKELDDVVNNLSTSELLAIPGIYEILREELNNEVLANICEQTEDRCDECGTKMIIGNSHFEYCLECMGDENE